MGKENERKCRWSIIGAVCSPFFLSLILSLIFAYCRSLGRQRWRTPLTRWSTRQGKLGERGAELCDATVVVTWSCRSCGSLAGPVCDLTFVTAADCEDYISKNRAGSSGGRKGSSQLLLLSCATTAQALGRWVSGGEKLAWLICKTTVSLFLSPIDPATKRNLIILILITNWFSFSNNGTSHFLERAR